MGNDVRIRTSVQGAKQATGEVRDLQSAFTTLQKQGAKPLISGIAAGATVQAFNVIGNAISGVTSYLGDSAEAYREDIKSQAALRASLAANEHAWDGNAQSIEKVLEERIKLGFSDDEQRTSLAFLVAVTKDHTKALDLQRAAMDLARLRGIDLAAASDILAKVYGGNIGILSRYGIQVAKGTSATEALAQVQRMAAGQAEAYAATIGKTEVAQIEAAEASEKFGKQIDRLQQFAMPLATDAIENLANQVDAASMAFDNSVPTTEKVDTAINMLNDSWLAGLPIVKDWVKQAEEEGRAAQEASEYEEQHGDALIGVRTAANDATPAVEDLADETDALADAAKDAHRAVDGLADSISEELFGEAINEGNLAELRKTRDELEKDRAVTKKGSREYKILTGEIAENQQALFELQLQMKEKEGPRAVIAWLQRQKEKFGDASGTIQTLINKYRVLLGLQSKLAGAPLAGGIAYTGANPGGGQPKHKAAGGPLKRGDVSWVGEQGPELVVAGQDSTVIPNHALGGMGGTLNVNVQVSGGILTPGAADDIARNLGPALVRYMQKGGHLAAPRAF